MNTSLSLACVCGTPRSAQFLLNVHNQVIIAQFSVSVIAPSSPLNYQRVFSSQSVTQTCWTGVLCVWARLRTNWDICKLTGEPLFPALNAQEAKAPIRKENPAPHMHVLGPVMEAI